MGPLISWCIQLSLFKAKPQSLPHSKPFLAVLIGLSYFIFTLSLRWQVSWYVASSVTLYILITQFVLLYIILLAARRKERFLKTFMAILIASILFQLLALPILMILSADAGLSAIYKVALETIVMFIQIWLMFIHAHILNCAINVGQLMAFLFVLAISVIQLRFIGLFVSS